MAVERARSAAERAENATKAADKAEYLTSVFKNLTPQQADDYIVANVTDLASAKVVMRRMVRVILYLVRRSDLG